MQSVITWTPKPVGSDSLDDLRKQVPAAKSTHPTGIFGEDDPPVTSTPKSWDGEWVHVEAVEWVGDEPDGCEGDEIEFDDRTTCRYGDGGWVMPRQTRDAPPWVTPDLRPRFMGVERHRGQARVRLPHRGGRERRPGGTRTRRTSATRAGPDGESGEPEPPGGHSAGSQHLLLVRPPQRAILTFACLSAHARGASVEQVP